MPANAGETLTVGESLKVGAVTFVMQKDGNFVAYKNDTVVWATNTMPELSVGAMRGKPTQGMPESNQYKAVFQTDGNLVLYGPQGAHWASGSSATRFSLSDTPPYIELLDASGRQVWLAVKTCQTWASALGPIQAFVGRYLCVTLPSGTFELESPILLRSGQSLAGQGKDNTILRASQAKWRFNGTDSMIASVGATHVTVQNLTIDAAGIATYAAASAGMTLDQLAMINGRCSSVGITGPGMVITNSIMAFSARTTNILGRGPINCASGNFGGVALGAAIYAQGTGNNYAPIIAHNRIYSNIGPALDDNGVWGGKLIDNDISDNKGWAAVSLYGASYWTISGNKISHPAEQPPQPYHSLCARGPAGGHSAAIMLCQDTDENNLLTDHNVIKENKVSGYYGILSEVAYAGQTPSLVPKDNKFIGNDVTGSMIGCADNSRQNEWHPNNENWSGNNCAGAETQK
jgi:Right handed beta helix region